MKIAVVGSGVSGLAATWLLNEYSNHEVHLYETDARPGGHANTVQFMSEKEKTVHVDTGFIVFNPSTYPNFLRFLGLYPEIKSRIQTTEMTFSVSRDIGLFEWAGNNLLTVFCQSVRLLDPRMWRLLYDVVRFNACARRLVIGSNGIVETRNTHDISIGEYLQNEGYSDSFRDNYLIPMTAAIWSTPPDKCALDFPARTLIQFMYNHHLLQITGKPSWLTLRGGSRVYVDKIISSLPPSQLHLSTPIASVATLDTSTPNHFQVQLTRTDDVTEAYDHVILACHSDIALELLRKGSGATLIEEEVLGSIKWTRNIAVLHSDTELMPKRRAAWSCWNYLTQSTVDKFGNKKANVDQVTLTYWMNNLQHISEEIYGPVFVTLNPYFEPDVRKTVGRYQYDHPIFDAEAIRAQQAMPTIQNARGISFAGAWMRYGFHEDGFTAGLQAALALSDICPMSVHPPFEVVEADRVMGAAWIANWFDVFENTGSRSVLGFILGWGLTMCQLVLGLGFDLRVLAVNTDRSTPKSET